MRTVLKTTIKDNNSFYIKETVTVLHKLLLEKGNYIVVTKVRFNNHKVILSQRKILIKKSTILMGDRIL